MNEGSVYQPARHGSGVFSPSTPAPAPRWAFTPSSVPIHPSVIYAGPRRASLCVRRLSPRSAALPSGDAGGLPGRRHSSSARELTGGRDSLARLHAFKSQTRIPKVKGSRVAGDARDGRLCCLVVVTSGKHQRARCCGATWAMFPFSGGKQP